RAGEAKGTPPRSHASSRPGKIRRKALPYGPLLPTLAVHHPQGFPARPAGAPMPHADSLILTLVGGFVLAFLFGMIANRLKLSPLVGYLVAGIIVGPHTAGFVADTELAPQLAEVGVILLMFGVGLHFSLAELMKVRKIAIPGALVQITAATVLGWG